MPLLTLTVLNLNDDLGGLVRIIDNVHIAKGGVLRTLYSQGIIDKRINYSALPNRVISALCLLFALFAPPPFGPTTVLCVCVYVTLFTYSPCSGLREIRLLCE